MYLDAPLRKLVGDNAGCPMFLEADFRMRVEIAAETCARLLALVRQGSPVRLEFESFPAVQFSGWPVLAQGLFDGRVRSVDPTAQPDGLFRVIVEPVPGEPQWPGRQFVRQGSKVLGWIQGATVSVGYEVWRQLNDFPLEFSRPVDVGPRKGNGGKALSDKEAGKAKNGKGNGAYGDGYGGGDYGGEEK